MEKIQNNPSDSPLQHESEGMLKVEGRKGYHFTNWSTTYSCDPEFYFEPRNTDEIKQILHQAKVSGRHVRVVGCGHSPSDITCTSEYMISLKYLNKIMKLDQTKCQVKFEAGMEISKLNEELDKNGLALSVHGSVPDLTYAGSISTGSHGTGANFGGLASYVVELELMKADGEIVRVTEESDKELFSAACVSLGCLGVILNLTVQCEPAFNLCQTKQQLPLEHVLSNLDKYVHSSDHFRFFWAPHTDGTLTFLTDRTSKPVKVENNWFWNYAVGYYLLEFLYFLSTFSSALVPYINKFIYHVLHYKKETVVDKSYKIFAIECLFKQYVTEWSIPSEHTGAVLRELRAWINRSKFGSHFPVEVRFVKQDKFMLSPSYGQDSCFINIIMYRPYNRNVDIEEYWDAFEVIMSKYNGRPHWAKDHKLTSEEFSRLYPEWQKFCKIRENMDPNGLFLNANTRKVFGITTDQTV